MLSTLCHQHAGVFENQEYITLLENIVLMLGDIRSMYERSLNNSHCGRPSVMGTLHTGHRGRPKIVFDPEFLAWAVTQRMTSGIANFLDVDRSTLRKALLEYGLATPGQNPFPNHEESFAASTSDANSNWVDLNEGDDILEPDIPIPSVLPSTLMVEETPSTSAISTMSDGDLDDLILRLRSHFRRAGIAMIDGMLRRLGHRVQRE
jgi:hypothetical protein